MQERQYYFLYSFLFHQLSRVSILFDALEGVGQNRSALRIAAVDGAAKNDASWMSNFIAHAKKRRKMTEKELEGGKTRCSNIHRRVAEKKKNE